LIFPLLFATFIALAPQNTTYPAVLDCIIEHESGGRQFAIDGAPLMSPTGDIGIFQINLRTWQPTAERMGLDLSNEKDNLEFGYWLYTTHGPQVWATYKDCEGAETG